MKNCPKCKSTVFRKDGIVKQRQRYLCKQCEYRFTVPYIGKSDKLKREALILYLEGLGFRSIARFLNVSHVAVFNWIKSFGKKLEDLRIENQIEVVEIDEMHTYIGSKKTTAGSGLLLIEMGNGLSTVKWVQGGPKQEKSFGNELKIK